MTPRGFLLPGFGITGYAMIAMGVVMILMGISLKVQTSRVHVWAQKYETFVAQTKAAGDAREAETKAEIAKHKGVTENVRKDYGVALAELNRLRNQYSGSGNLPAPSNSTKGADVAPAEHATDSSSLESRAADDALKLYYLQEFLREQGFPVE